MFDLSSWFKLYTYCERHPPTLAHLYYFQYWDESGRGTITPLSLTRGHAYITHVFDEVVEKKLAALRLGHKIVWCWSIIKKHEITSFASPSVLKRHMTPLLSHWLEAVYWNKINYINGNETAFYLYIIAFIVRIKCGLKQKKAHLPTVSEKSTV